MHWALGYHFSLNFHLALSFDLEKFCIMPVSVSVNGPLSVAKQQIVKQPFTLLGETQLWQKEHIQSSVFQSDKNKKQKSVPGVGYFWTGDFFWEEKDIIKSRHNCCCLQVWLPFPKEMVGEIVTVESKESAVSKFEEMFSVCSSFRWKLLVQPGLYSLVNSPFLSWCTVVLCLHRRALI